MNYYVKWHGRANGMTFTEGPFPTDRVAKKVAKEYGSTAWIEEGESDAVVLDRIRALANELLTETLAEDSPSAEYDEAKTDAATRILAALRGDE